MNQFKTARILIALILCAVFAEMAVAVSFSPDQSVGYGYPAPRTLHPSRVIPDQNRTSSYFAGNPSMFGVKVSRKAKSYQNLMALRADKAMTKQAKHDYRFKVTPPPAYVPGVYGGFGRNPAVATAAGNDTAMTIPSQNAQPETQIV
jgi:hypothetical protein